jgi:predicted aminopeptidase
MHNSKRAYFLRRSAVVLLLLFLMFVGGCSTLGYYYQSIHGHFTLMGDSRSISEVLQDNSTNTDLKEKLQLVQEARNFASAELGLPENRSYQSYAALDKEAVVWSVVATPEFSVQPKQWCFPVVGCASYRGYFKKEEAQEYADNLRKQGMDVTVVPNPAYSTLGWFADPLPSTVINWPESHLVGLIFHELAHQQLYVSGDSAFNEAFAMTVEQVGVERWFNSRRDASGLRQWSKRKQMQEEFTDMLLATRERLQQLYARQISESEMRVFKGAEFDRLNQEYLRLKQRWNGYNGFDHWFESDLNNARLASVATYERFVPAFLKMLSQAKGNLKTFYQSCKTMGGLPPEQRNEKLEALLRQG